MNNTEAPARMRCKWTDGEEKVLLAAFDKSMPLDEIAERHQRTTGSIINRLYKLGADLNGALITACENSNHELMSMILKLGVNPSAGRKFTSGKTPLHIAIQNNDYKAAWILIKHGAATEAPFKEIEEIASQYPEQSLYHNYLERNDDPEEYNIPYDPDYHDPVSYDIGQTGLKLRESYHRRLKDIRSGSDVIEQAKSNDNLTLYMLLIVANELAYIFESETDDSLNLTLEDNNERLFYEIKRAYIHWKERGYDEDND